MAESVAEVPLNTLFTQVATHGLAVVIAVIVIWFLVRYFNLKIFGPRNPMPLKAEDRTDLRRSSLFGLINKTIEKSKTLVIRVDGERNAQRTAMARDLLQYSLLVVKISMEQLLKEAYEHKGGFDDYVETHGLQSLIDECWRTSKQQLRYRLVFECGIDAEVVYEAWAAFRYGHDESMAEMFQLAIAEHDTAYDRVHGILTSYYAMVLGLPRAVDQFFTSYVEDRIDELPTYEAKPAGTMEFNTPDVNAMYNARQAGTANNYGMFEGNWRLRQ